jgi:hypothetical protein
VCPAQGGDGAMTYVIDSYSVLIYGGPDVRIYFAQGRGFLGTMSEPVGEGE